MDAELWVLLTDIELWLWVLLPLAVAATLAAGSLYNLCRDFRTAQVLLAVPALLLTAGAAWILVEMLAGGWPTFVPHVALVLAVPPVLTQAWLRRTRVATTP